MKTQERILQTALSLFNRDGVTKTTVRHIAAKMGISHGNLCYHYTDTGEIVFALYLEMVSGLDHLIHVALEKEIDLTRLLEINRSSFDLLFRYRFIFIDFAHIMRSNAKLRTHYRKLAHVRKSQITIMLEALVMKGFLKKEPIKDHFKQLAEIYMVLVNFWMTEAEITLTGSLRQRMNYFIPVIQSFLVPYLTSKGLQQYLDHQKHQSHEKT